jgi:hypothetical protein
MSRTVIVDIVSNQFPAVTVEPGTFVVWRNLDAVPHSVETKSATRDYFNAGAMLPGETSSPILFAKTGNFPYLCRFHTNMNGVVTVGAHGNGHDHGGHDHGGHGGGHDHGLHHYHGFVTSGRSGNRLYMTHTPVLADERHNYQVILRGHFENPEHAALYDALRASEYGDQVVQIFHDHMSMPDIGTGQITLLPNASVAYWPGGTQTSIGPTQSDIPGLEDVPVIIDEVLHFHQFDTDASYPAELTYIMYGDAEEVYIDHWIDRAPSFHSVAKLARVPAGWQNAGAQSFTVTGKSIRQLEPRTVSKFAMVDNAFHLYWLLPPGQLVRQAQDPLIVRGNPLGATHNHEIKYESGNQDAIAISRFLHFDIRLLNYGVLIVG